LLFFLKILQVNSKEIRFLRFLKYRLIFDKINILLFTFKVKKFVKKSIYNTFVRILDSALIGQFPQALVNLKVWIQIILSAYLAVKKQFLMYPFAYIVYICLLFYLLIIYLRVFKSKQKAAVLILKNKKSFVHKSKDKYLFCDRAT